MMGLTGWAAVMLNPSNRCQRCIAALLHNCTLLCPGRLVIQNTHKNDVSWISAPFGTKLHKWDNLVVNADIMPKEILTFSFVKFKWNVSIISLPLINAFIQLSFNGLTLCPVSWRPWQHRIAKEQKDGECLDQEAVLGNVGDGDGGEVGRRHQGDLVERPFPIQWHFSLLFILPQSLKN